MARRAELLDFDPILEYKFSQLVIPGLHPSLIFDVSVGMAQKSCTLPEEALSARFIHTTSANPTLDNANKRMVRSNAMRSFRRRQRNGESSDLSGINSASNLAYRKHRESRLQRQREPRRQQHLSSLDERSPDSSREFASYVSSSEPEICIIQRPDRIFTLHSPMVYQCSISSAFFAGTISRRERDLPAIKRRFEHWLNPRSNALKAALQAVVLFEFGSTTNNKSASVEGLKWHVRALECLRCDLQKPKADLLAAQATAQMLLFCGNYEVACQPGGSRGYQIEGLKILHTLARVDSKLNDPFEKALFQTLRLISLMNGLTSRKSLDVRFFEGRYCLQGRAEDLIRSALFLPAILEETDKILTRSVTETQSLYKLILRACVLDTDLELWRVNHTSFHDDTECSLMPLHHLDTERKNIENMYLCDEFEKAFGHAIEFDTFLCANLHTFYWICLLLLRHCMHSLIQALSLSSFQTALVAQNPKSALGMTMENMIASLTRRSLTAEIRDAADSLCKTVPYLLSATDGSCSMAMAVAAPLNFALDIYARTQQQDKKIWCLRMIQKIQRTVPFLDWDAVIGWHMYAILWLAQ